jgi:hypothetical protein
VITPNPHNQTLFVAVQLGIVGAAILFAMWLAHFLLFRVSGAVASMGLLIVAQNIIGSLFNSHLLDFTQGWIYVFGVGVCGGTVLRYSGSIGVQARAMASDGTLPPSFGAKRS